MKSATTIKTKVTIMTMVIGFAELKTIIRIEIVDVDESVQLPLLCR